MSDQVRGTIGALERLRNRRDFVAAGKGMRRRFRTFTLQAVCAEGREGLPPRIGLTVTKKVGNSPERNRIRRRLRAALRTAAVGADHAGYDYVIVARRECLVADFRALAGDLARALAGISPEFGRRARPPHGRSADEPGPGERPN